MRTLRTLAWPLGFLFLIASAIEVAVDSPVWSSVVGILISFTVTLSLWLLGAILKFSETVHQIRRISPQPEPISYDTVLDDISLFAHQVTRAQADTYWELVVSPQRFFGRIAESATPHDGHISVSSKYTVELPTIALTQPFVVPLIVKPRGTLSDGLKIFDGGASRISSLPQSDSVAYVAAVCRVLVRIAGGRRLERRYVADVEMDVVTVLAAHEPVSASDMRNLLLAIANLQARRIPRESIVRLILLLRELRLYYPINVEVNEQSPARGRDSTPLRWVVNQDVTLARRFGTTLARPKLVLRLRATVENVRLFGLTLVGVRPNLISVPLGNADRARSYHLQIKGLPEDTYVGTQSFDHSTDGNDNHYERPIRGQAFSHIYIQFGQRFADRYFYNRIYEMPPGSIGIAAAIALVSAFGVLITAPHQLNWVPSSSLSGLNILLSLPGAVGAFVGFRRSSGFLRGSFLARLSTLVSLLVSLAAIASTALVVRKTHYSVHLVMTDFAALSPSLVFWLVLSGAQLFNIVITVGAWLYRTFIFLEAKRV